MGLGIYQNSNVQKFPVIPQTRSKGELDDSIQVSLDQSIKDLAEPADEFHNSLEKEGGRFYLSMPCVELNDLADINFQIESEREVNDRHNELKQIMDSMHEQDAEDSSEDEDEQPTGEPTPVVIYDAE